MIRGAERLTLRCRDLSFTAWSLGQGPLVLLLHGFPDTPATFQHQVPALAAAGYRAVAVTSRGYEPGSQPANGSYYMCDLAQDVIDWIAALGQQQAHVVGHDWGATIAFAAAALEPDAVSSVTVMAVPQPRRFLEALTTNPAQLERSSYMFFFQQAGTAEAAVQVDDFRYLEQLWLKWSPGWAFGDAEIADMKRLFREPGVVTAALSYYRNVMDAVSPRGLAGQALLAPPVGKPTLGIYGALDGCIGADVFEHSMRPEDFTNRLQLARIEGAGHFAHREQPEKVNELLLRFLAGRPLLVR